VCYNNPMRSLLPIAFVTLSVAALTGCAASHDYLGERYAPTEFVEVYYPHEPVPDGYVVIGTNRTEANESAEAEDVVAEIVVKAQEVGAHAVAIERYSIEFAGTTRQTDVDHDRHGYTERTRVSDRRVKVFESVFLRRGGE